MDGMPDPTKRPHELREEIARKVSELVTNEINRVGRERIEAGVRKLENDYGIEVNFRIDLDMRMSMDPMSGEDFKWPELKAPGITFDDDE